MYNIMMQIKSEKELAEAIQVSRKEAEELMNRMILAIKGSN